MPVGFKNGTDGGIQVALNALHSASTTHHFLGIDQQGRVSIFKTKGNAYGHVILRGGSGKSNFDPENVKLVEDKLRQANLPPRIVIDCSHGNSNKNYKLQAVAFDNSIQQILAGNKSIMGMMLESHLSGGNQPLPSNLEELKYGVSVTDQCIGWEETERLILAAYANLSKKSV
jgi:3-deoxy-7-phosphoheptulonate synthase